MDSQTFLTALDERIAHYDLLCHPYYKAWTAGELTRDDLRAYAGDYYLPCRRLSDLPQRVALPFE